MTEKGNRRELTVNTTQNNKEFLKKRLSKGNFVTTKTAFVKLLAILLLFVGLAVFFSKPNCKNTDSWYKWLYPTGCLIAVAVVLILYICFAIGLAIKNTKLWIKFDISISCLLSILVIIVSVLTMNNCDETAILHKVPGPLGLCGAGILIISMAAMFLLYRYEPMPLPTSPVPTTPRVKEDVFA